MTPRPSEDQAVTEKDPPPSRFASPRRDVRFRATLEHAAIGLADIALDGRWLSVNPRLCAITGYTPEELLSHDWFDVTYPDDRAKDEEQVRRLISGEIEAYSIEKRLVRPHGDVVPVNMTISLVSAPTGEPGYFIGVVEDITERKRAQEALRLSTDKLQALSGRLVAVQETERRAIARELHDQIGQILTGLSLTLALGKRLTGEALARNQGQAEELVQDAISRVRQLSLELRPAMLDDLGLLPALIWHFQRFTAQTSIRVELRHTLTGQRFSPEIETASYRIVQEALTNVARYAGVNEARVYLWTRRGWLYVQIAEDGAGFVPEQALTSYTSSGLTGMQERAALLGGRFRMESALGAGTCILVEFPVTEFPVADPIAPQRNRP